MDPENTDRFFDLSKDEPVIEEQANGKYDDHELVIELNKRLERERQLFIILQDKEREARNLNRTYNDLKAKMLSNQTEARKKPFDIEVDGNILKELNTLKNRIKEKTDRLILFEKEIEDFNKNPSEQDLRYRNKGAEDIQLYQKYANENNVIENHIRTEFFKSSIDAVQSFKQLGEHLMYEIEKANALKTELENDKVVYDACVKKIRNEYKRIQDENARLEQELERPS